MNNISYREILESKDYYIATPIGTSMMPMIRQRLDTVKLIKPKGRLKKYDVEIEPDFIGTKNSAQFAFSVHIRPIFFINAVIVLAIRLVFKVVLKFLKGIKNKSNKENINEGGAL